MRYVIIAFGIALAGAAGPAPAAPGSPAGNLDEGYLFKGDGAGQVQWPLERLDKRITSDEPIHICYPNGVDDVKVKETRRKSRFAEDVSLLFKHIKGLKATTKTDYKCISYRLKHKRATVKVAAVAGDEELESVTIITGPPEHFYLGLDLPVDSEKTLEYDRDTGVVLPKEDDPQIYLSLNYYFGDLADPDSNSWTPRDFFSGLSLKAMVLATKRPLDSYGLGVGLQLPDISIANLDLNALHLFGGYVWTKEDDPAMGPEGVNTQTEGHWRIGVSYDLGTALKWTDD